MHTKSILTSAVLAAALAAHARAASTPAPTYRVIVNVANGSTNIGRDDLARIFLKKTTTWPNGQTAQPVDQSLTSPVRKAFSQSVLGKDVAAVESYWQQAIFSGRALPPFVKTSDADVLAYVRAN